MGVKEEPTYSLAKLVPQIVAQDKETNGVLIYSEHTSRRHDITHASFFISPDHTRGAPLSAQPNLPCDTINRVCGKVLPAFTHAPSPIFRIMSTEYGNNLDTLIELQYASTFSQDVSEYPLFKHY